MGRNWQTATPCIALHCRQAAAIDDLDFGLILQKNLPQADRQEESSMYCCMLARGSTGSCCGSSLVVNISSVDLSTVPHLCLLAADCLQHAGGFTCPTLSGSQQLLHRFLQPKSVYIIFSYEILIADMRHLQCVLYWLLHWYLQHRSYMSPHARHV